MAPSPIVKYRVLYLGASLPTISKEGLLGIQEPLKALLHVTTPTSGNNDENQTRLHPELQSCSIVGLADDAPSGVDCWFSVWSNGLLIEYVQPPPKGTPAKIFHPIQTLHFCAAVRYNEISYETVAGRRAPTSHTPAVNAGESSLEDAIIEKYPFLPVDSPIFSKSGSDTEKDNPRRFAFEKPPIFTCTVRRTHGVRVLECHAFLCKSDDIAFDICLRAKDAYIENMKLFGPLLASNKGTKPDRNKDEAHREGDGVTTDQSDKFDGPPLPPRGGMNPSDITAKVQINTKNGVVLRDEARLKQHSSGVRSMSGQTALTPVQKAKLAAETIEKGLESEIKMARDSVGRSFQPPKFNTIHSIDPNFQLVASPAPYYNINNANNTNSDNNFRHYSPYGNNGYGLNNGQHPLYHSFYQDHLYSLSPTVSADHPFMHSPTLSYSFYESSPIAFRSTPPSSHANTASPTGAESFWNRGRQYEFSSSPLAGPAVVSPYMAPTPLLVPAYVTDLDYNHTNVSNKTDGLNKSPLGYLLTRPVARQQSVLMPGSHQPVSYLPNGFSSLRKQPEVGNLSFRSPPLSMKPSSAMYLPGTYFHCLSGPDTAASPLVKQRNRYLQAGRPVFGTMTENRRNVDKKSPGIFGPRNHSRRLTTLFEPYTPFQTAGTPPRGQLLTRSSTFYGGQFQEFVPPSESQAAHDYAGAQHGAYKFKSWGEALNLIDSEGRTGIEGVHTPSKMPNGYFLMDNKKAINAFPVKNGDVGRAKGSNSSSGTGSCKVESLDGSITGRHRKSVFSKFLKRNKNSSNVVNKPITNKIFKAFPGGPMNASKFFTDTKYNNNTLSKLDRSFEEPVYMPSYFNGNNNALPLKGQVYVRGQHTPTDPYLNTAANFITVRSRSIHHQLDGSYPQPGVMREEGDSFFGDPRNTNGMARCGNVVVSSKMPDKILCNGSVDDSSTHEIHAGASFAKEGSSRGAGAPNATGIYRKNMRLNEKSFAYSIREGISSHYDIYGSMPRLANQSYSMLIAGDDRTAAHQAPPEPIVDYNVSPRKSLDTSNSSSFVTESFKESNVSGANWRSPSKASQNMPPKAPPLPQSINTVSLSNQEDCAREHFSASKVNGDVVSQGVNENSALNECDDSSKKKPLLSKPETTSNGYLMKPNGQNPTIIASTTYLTANGTTPTKSNKMTSKNYIKLNHAKPVGEGPLSNGRPGNSPHSSSALKLVGERETAPLNKGAVAKVNGQTNQQRSQQSSNTYNNYQTSIGAFSFM